MVCGYKIPNRGLTLLEVLLAVFIFSVGIIGVLAALPTGVRTASIVVFQDAAIHLSSSKFAEFRRDRIDPAVDLNSGSSYMVKRQEPDKGGGWREFAHGTGEAYQYFDGIERYEWKVEAAQVGSAVDASPGQPTAPYRVPIEGGTDIGLRATRITIRMKGTTNEFGFTQYIYSYEAGYHP